MAIFGFKKKNDDKAVENAAAAKTAVKKTRAAKAAPKKAAAAKPAKTVTVASPAVAGSASSYASVIIRPRITEKSGLLSQSNKYTFEIEAGANKERVSRAIRALYKVTPVKVSIMNVAAKNVFVKGRHGTVAGMKKAIVTLKAGDKIEFV